jgi:hypothetical protein
MMNRLHRRYGRAEGAAQDPVKEALSRAAQIEFPGKANADLRTLFRAKYEEWKRDWSKEEPDVQRFLLEVMRHHVHPRDHEKLARVVRAMGAP